MPSPFKEREKRKKDPRYVDDKRRLSVRVVLEGTTPVIRWQCWWSKGQTGKAVGGRSTYALALVTKVSQKEISDLLGLRWDEAVEKAETMQDKVLAILTQPRREQEAREAFHQKTQEQVISPRPVPSSFLSLWEGNPLTTGAEMMVAERGISKEIGQQYGLAWDWEEQAVLIPWFDQEKQCRIYQWWYGEKYRFPYDQPGYMTKGDAIFGLHLVDQGRPLPLCEGCFTAMSVCGAGLGGSSITDVQVGLLVKANPKWIIPAFDNDSGGLFGAAAISKRLSQELPNSRVTPVFPPEKNDWNDYLKVYGFQKTIATFAERVRQSMTMSPALAIASQYRGPR